ncbi:MAG: SDR family NAD(P)-dependent oxidoreductase [Actinobacteria bacterium]|nr:SDR family NAD(P)-dependent oxidoreductase [Actinomycetota bacterium]
MDSNSGKSSLPLQVIPRGWNASDLGDQSGRHFLITGATSGIGLESARELIRAGAQVTIAARDLKKADQVVKELSSQRATVLELDLSDLTSVRRAAREVKQEIDVLILNAGVMATPYRKTADDFELQMGVNHLGHFALAGLLSDRIKSRVVSVSSAAHRFGNFGQGSQDAIRDICLGRIKYQPWSAYGASKLANLLFTFELERIARKANYSFSAFAAIILPVMTIASSAYPASFLKCNELFHHELQLLKLKHPHLILFQLL